MLNENCKKYFNEFGVSNVNKESTRVTYTSSTLIDVLVTWQLFKPKLNTHTRRITRSKYVILNWRKSILPHGTREITHNIATFINTLALKCWIATYDEEIWPKYFKHFTRHSSTTLKLYLLSKKVKPNRKKWKINDLKNLHNLLCDMSKIARQTDNVIIKNKSAQLKTMYYLIKAK